MIPRRIVAVALGLPEDTGSLPDGDLPLDRFGARYVGYLAAGDTAQDAPDAWTGAVMDHLMQADPDLAFAALRAGLPHDAGGHLADPLAELGSNPEMKLRIEAEAASDPALAARLDTGE